MIFTFQKEIWIVINWDININGIINGVININLIINRVININGTMIIDMINVSIR